MKTKTKTTSEYLAEISEVLTKMQTCDCGQPAQWWGDRQGLRIFACRKCAIQQGADMLNHS